MTDFFRSFLDCVNAFFTVYLVGYSTFLFLSVVVGSIDLYQCATHCGRAIMFLCPFWCPPTMRR